MSLQAARDTKSGISAKKGRTLSWPIGPTQPCGLNQEQKLVGGLEPWNFMTFHILGIVTPTDELIFFRGVETTNQEGVCGSERIFDDFDGRERNSRWTPSPESSGNSRAFKGCVHVQERGTESRTARHSRKIQYRYNYLIGYDIMRANYRKGFGTTKSEA